MTRDPDEARTALDPDVLEELRYQIAMTLLMIEDQQGAMRILQAAAGQDGPGANRDRQTYRLLAGQVLQTALHTHGHPIDAGAMRIVGIVVPDNVSDFTRIRRIELDPEHRMMAAVFDAEPQ